MAAARNQRAQQRAPQQQQRRPQSVPASSALSKAGSDIDSLMADDDKVSIITPTETSVLESLTKSEVMMQLEAAHRWPRSIKRFQDEAIALATLDPVTAASCMYAVPRDGTTIEGKSVRLAEICAGAWTNLHVGMRIMDIGAREVTAMALAWDLEKNLRLGAEVRRSIIGKKGRYSDSMIQTTCMAAISIAYRNAVFRVIPGSLTNIVYESAKATAVGDEKSLSQRRTDMMGWLSRKQISPERVFARLGVAGLQDITLDHLATMIGLAQAIKAGDVTADEAFPLPAERGPAPPPRSKGAALDALADADELPAKPAGFTPLQLLALLAGADEAWDSPNAEDGAKLLATIQKWSPEEQQAAHAWASAHADTSIDDADMPPRPAHTMLDQPGREPGEEG